MELVVSTMVRNLSRKKQITNQPGREGKNTKEKYI